MLQKDKLKVFVYDILPITKSSTLALLTVN
jgi:hypothetical protein